ncbi:glycerol acyltransferase [Calothrix sp. 336/3]|nr:glycerol acyltransferase [Calothrix sp. 336/3]
MDTYHPTPVIIPPEVHVNRTTSQVSPWLGPAAYFLGRHFVLPSFFRQITVTGQANVPQQGAVILAPTHRARWDALLVPYVAGRCVTGRDLHFMVTISECKGLQGWLVKQMGGFPVDTKRPSVGTLRHGVQLLQQKQMLVIFPEGGIFRDRQVHPLKPGIARLALTAEHNHPGLGVKILPIAINYSQPYPGWGTDVHIHIGSSIEAAEYTQGCVKQEAKRLTSDLSQTLHALSNHQSPCNHHSFAEIAMGMDIDDR